LSTFETSNRGTALAIIKQFVLAEGEFLHNSIGKRENYEANLPTPFQKKIKFSEQISENVNDDRISDMMFDDMSEQELLTCQ
jgi:hypothetical protein